MLTRTRGRPRLTAAVRTRIVQIRASNPGRPPSIDKILDQLQDERFDPLPGRGSVQNIIRQWEDLPENLRLRDMPFTWHRMEDCRAPWEASEWVCECQWILEETRLRYVSGSAKALDNPQEYERQFRTEFEIPPHVVVQNIPTSLEQIIEGARRNLIFTNRWAVWCWRVHLAVPDLTAGHVLGIAQRYALEEQAYDLLVEHPVMDVADVDAWLTFRPYMDSAMAIRYEFATDVGLAPKLRTPIKEVEATDHLTSSLEAEGHSVDSTTGLGWALGRQVFMSPHEKRVEREVSEDERQPTSAQQE